MGFERGRRHLLHHLYIICFHHHTIKGLVEILVLRSALCNERQEGVGFFDCLDRAIDQFLGNKIAIGHIVHDGGDILKDSLATVWSTRKKHTTKHTGEGILICSHKTLRGIDIAVLLTKNTEKEFAKHKLQHLIVGIGGWSVLETFLPGLVHIGMGNGSGRLYLLHQMTIGGLEVVGRPANALHRLCF